MTEPSPSRQIARELANISTDRAMNLEEVKPGIETAPGHPAALPKPGGSTPQLLERGAVFWDSLFVFLIVVGSAALFLCVMLPRGPGPVTAWPSGRKEICVTVDGPVSRPSASAYRQSVR
jgi:hypothetical protein